MGHELAPLFDYGHLPPELQEVSRPFAELASEIMYGAKYQGNVGLQKELLTKLWEAKNLAVVMAVQYNN